MSNAPWFVSAETTKEVLTWPELIAALKAAYAMPHVAEENPPRAVARGQGVWLRALPAVLPSRSYMGAKVFGLGRQRAVTYAIVLFDQETGGIAGLLDGESLTAFRTAATSAVAMDRLLPRRPVRLGLLGSGAEARSHLHALAAIRPIAAARVFSPSAENRAAFAAAARAELAIECSAAASARDAVADQPLVVAAARSRDETPIFDSAWLADDSLVVSIGSTLPDQREIDTGLISKSDIIVADAVEEVAEGTGDFIAAHREGVAFRDKIVSLNDLIRGVVDARVNAARRPLFKSVGAAIQDLVVAELALRKAKQLGAAHELPADFVLKTGTGPRNQASPRR